MKVLVRLRASSMGSRHRGEVVGSQGALRARQGNLFIFERDPFWGVGATERTQSGPAAIAPRENGRAVILGLRNEAIFPSNPHKRKPLASSGAKPPTRAQTGRMREMATLVAGRTHVRIGRQFYATTGARASSGRRVGKWLRGRGK